MTCNTQRFLSSVRTHFKGREDYIRHKIGKWAIVIHRELRITTLKIAKTYE